MRRAFLVDLCRMMRPMLRFRVNWIWGLPNESALARPTPTRTHRLLLNSPEKHIKTHSELAFIRLAKLPKKVFYEQEILPNPLEGEYPVLVQVFIAQGRYTEAFVNCTYYN